MIGRDSELDSDTPTPFEKPHGPPPGVKSMAIVRWALVILMGVIATVSILGYAGVWSGGKGASSGQLYYCPMHPSVVQDHPGECPICSMTLVPKPQGNVKPSSTMKPAVATADGGSQPAAGGKYYCPMHPNRTSDDPNARCPDCGMKLEPRPPAAEAGNTAPATAIPAVPGLGAVDLTPERIQLIGMRTAAVKREALAGELRTTGVVGANERGLAQITTRFAGWIQKLTVSTTGERVRRGQVLATIYSPDVLRAEQELLVASGWAQGSDNMATGLAANARRRLELLGISAQEIDEVLRTGKPSEAVAIRSPVEGYVVSKNAVAGVALQPGTVLFEVADLSNVWVTAEVYELDISRVHVGQRARFELSSFPGEIHTGKVQFVYPVLDGQSRTLKVRLEFRNRSDRSGPRLRPGMYGTVHLDLPATTGLMVPAEAVVDTGEMHYVFVAKDGGHFEPRLVKVGTRSQGKVEIASGVAEGEKVVTTGNFLIDSESRLRAAIEGQGSPGSSPPPTQQSTADTEIDGQKYPDKLRAYRACEIQHRGMGTMEEDCKKAIPKPWR
jgi:membrane fusion protein, copper/silver efflux system